MHKNSKVEILMEENTEFLTEQIITYLGNKRALLDFINDAVEEVLTRLNKNKINTFDVFSGSGIVSRYLKKYSNTLYTNDLEDYCYTINKCYLTNKKDIDFDILDYWYNKLNLYLTQKPLIENGFIYKLYAPKNDNDIKLGERVFYTTRNAKYIDSYRQYLEIVPEPYKTLLLGPLLYESSTKNNTSGVFRGFYKNSKTNIGQFGGNGKNSLRRILSDIEIKKPVLSNFNCKVKVLQGDANEICKKVPKVDLAYIDPPYNQHPYSSNYFMLNLINNYDEPKEISKVSGIPPTWNKSLYNKKEFALKTMKNLCENIKAKFILISYNSDGFISCENMIEMLNSLGKVEMFDKQYNVFRACRNLRDRDIHVTEYLFLLTKGEN